MSKSPIILFILTLVLSVPFGVSGSTSQPEPLKDYQVLILIGPQYGLPMVDEILPALMHDLKEGGVSLNNIFVEFLDMHRNTNPLYRADVLALLEHKLKERELELIIAINQGAVDFVVREAKDLFPDVPMLIPILEKHPEWEGEPRKLITLTTRQDAAGTLSYALKLFPKAKRAVIIMGKDDHKAPFVEPVSVVLDAVRNGLEIETTENLTFEEMLGMVSDLPQNTVAFYGSYFHDITGRSFAPAEVARRVGETANVPVFAFRDMHIASGLAGGSVASTADMGRLAAQISLDYLDGKLVLEEPVTNFNVPNFPLFNWMQLKQMGGNISTLPENTIFLNRPLTIWEQHSEIVITAAISFVLLVLLLIALASRTGQQRKLIIKLNEAEITLRESEGKFRSVFESANVGKSITLPTGEINVNEAYCNMLGYSCEELNGIKWQEITHKEDIQINHKVIDSLIKGEEDYARFEKRYIHKNGSILWADLSATMVRDKNGKPLHFITTIIDISEKKKAIEEQLRVLNIIEQSRNEIYVFDEKTLQFEFVNQGTLENLGYTLTEIKSMTPFGINPEIKEETFRELIKPLQDGSEQRLVFETVHQRKNGSTYPVEMFLQLQKSGDKTIFLAVINNITIRKNAEQEIIAAKERVEQSLSLVKEKNEEYEALNEELREANEHLSLAKEKAEENELKYKMFIEQTSEGVYRLDVIPPVKTNLPIDELIDYLYDHAIVTECNLAMAKMYNLTSPEDLLNLKLSDFHGGKDIPTNRNEVKKFVLNGFYVNNEETIEKDVDGNVHYFYNNSIGIIKDDLLHSIWGTQTDISEKKKYEFELIKAKEHAEENEKKYKELFETSQDGIVITDLNCAFLDCNKAFLNIIGYSSLAEILKKTYEELTPKEFHELERKIITEQTLVNGYCDEYEKEFIKGDGSRIPVSLQAWLRKDKNSKPIGMWVIVRDISEYKKYENELILAKEKAEQSDQLKTAFLHNMSHEVRTPLNAIVGFSERITSPKITDEKRNFYTNIIVDSSFQLLNIVDDILTISSLDTKQEEVRIEEVNVDSILQEVILKFEKKAQDKSVSLTAKSPHTDIQLIVNTDKFKLIHTLGNLLLNAIKFTHAGEIEIGYTQNGNLIEFYVSDTGIGIPAERFEAIFERFIQADTSIHTDYGGTGLGLSICKGFIEMLGGRIWAESELGKGSTFRFTLPVNETGKLEVSNAKSEISIGNNQNITVLVVEDQEFNFVYIEEFLLDHNCKVLHAWDGQEAIEHCRENPDIDLVLMDIRMPILDGFSATKLIREIRPNLPVIAQTAYATADEIAKFSEVFDEYITKPFSEAKLQQIFNQFVKR